MSAGRLNAACMEEIDEQSCRRWRRDVLRKAAP
jgi:hypothetical protein